MYTSSGMCLPLPLLDDEGGLGVRIKSILCDDSVVCNASSVRFVFARRAKAQNLGGAQDRAVLCSYRATFFEGNRKVAPHCVLPYGRKHRLRNIQFSAYSSNFVP